jgi:hypothetical protein
MPEKEKLLAPEELVTEIQQKFSNWETFVTLLQLRIIARIVCKLRDKDLDDEEYDKVVEELKEACPWLAQHSGYVSAQTDVLTAFNQLAWGHELLDINRHARSHAS